MKKIIIRKTIWFRKEEAKKLEVVAKRTGKSESLIIRELLGTITLIFFLSFGFAHAQTESYSQCENELAQITTTDNTAISNAQAIPVPTLQDDKAACANQMDPYTYLSCEGLALRGAGPATEARLAQIQTAQTKQQTDISTKTAECNALPDSPTSIQANQVQGGGGGQLNTPTPIKATATAPVSTPTVIQCPAPIDTSTFQKQIDDLTTQNTTLRTQITSMQNTITSLQKIAKQPITPVYVAPSPVATTPVIVPAPIVIPIVQQPKPVGFWQKIINWFK